MVLFVICCSIVCSWCCLWGVWILMVFICVGLFIRLYILNFVNVVCLRVGIYDLWNWFKWIKCFWSCLVLGFEKFLNSCEENELFWVLFLKMFFFWSVILILCLMVLIVCLFLGSLLLWKVIMEYFLFCIVRVGLLRGKI